VASRKVGFSLRRLPSGLGSYPRVLLTRRPDLLTLTDPPEIELRLDRVRIDPRKVAAYADVCAFAANAIRDGYVPVTYPHVLAMPLHLRIMGMKAFPLRPMGLIHVSNTIAQPGELAAGMTVALQVAARNYRKTDAGMTFDMDTEIHCDEELLWRETCVFLSRWPEAAQQRTGTRPARPPKAPRDARVLAELEVDLGRAWSYARVARDFNPIHLSDRAARFFGLRGAISHGMWSLARSLAEAPVDQPPAAGRLETQFLAPVQLPARVCVKQWDEQGQSRRALCDVRTGRLHMYAYWTTAPATPPEPATAA
jgi:acyl dehydratase